MLKLLLTVALLYVLIFWLLAPTLTQLVQFVSEHYAWMRP